MNNASFFDFKLNLTAFGRFNCFFDIHRHRPDFRVWHQVAGAQHFAQTTDNGHHIRCRNAAIKVDLAALHDFHQIFCANNIRTGGQSFFSFRATGEHSNPNGFTCAVGQVHCTANHLIGVTRVNTKVHRNLK